MEILLTLALLLLIALLVLNILAWQRQNATAATVDRTPELLGQIGTVRELTGHQLAGLKLDLTTQRQELNATLGDHRATLQALSKALAEAAGTARVEQQKQAETNAEMLRRTLLDMAERVDKLSLAMRKDAEDNRKTLETKMAELQKSNEERLEQMRHTVDEKLQKTLEARLGESFKLVSDRLEAVQLGLGEMRTLADGVGDLKKVMTNVKTRGTWGEVQLRALIEDILRPEEYIENFAPSGRGERVEFAVRLPGQVDNQPIYLPIDSKLPVEDYARMVAAQELGDLAAATVSAKALEDRIKGCAKDIRDKYLVPGKTTDFAILFLPFEGLYAEVLRRPGLSETLQREFKVVVAGPTTLGAVLHSLRMGFRAVAIQKRSGDIGHLLAAVKTEFEKFGVVIEKVGERLSQAQAEISQVGVRTRQINRKLHDVEVLPDEAADALLTHGE
jgi:DNA recombination protein RmuC